MRSPPPNRSTPARIAHQTNQYSSPGSIASITLIGVPSALAVPQSSAEIWHGLFTHGMALMPKVGATVAAAYALAAYDTRSRGGNWAGYLAAAGLAISIVPFTLAFMGPTNAALMGAAKGSTPLAQSGVAELVRKWAVLNATRSVLPLAAAVAGIVTFLSNVDY